MFRPKINVFKLICLLVFSILFSACAPGRSDNVLRIATTTSTYDSGLTDAITPQFEAQEDATVEYIAVGTGEALKLGERGDVDLVMVHAPALEEAFVAEGYGLERHLVMFNDFIIVGPPGDPADVSHAPDAASALKQIAEKASPFASRGDNSGTHTREKSIWALTDIEPSETDPWYFSLGQGMAATLRFANEEAAYAITDRGTFISQQENLPGLKVLFKGASTLENPDPVLYNQYSVIVVNPEKYDNINADLAEKFALWITSDETQEAIGHFGLDKYGVQLFVPNAGAK